MFSALFTKVHRNFAAWPNAVLSGSLMLAALVIFCIALLSDHELLKGLVLAYVVLP